MARYVHSHRDIPKDRSSEEYVDVPGYMGAYGQVEVKAGVPFWAIAAGLGGVYWFFIRKKTRQS